MAYDNTVQAGRSALIRYQFHIPADVEGPLTITARVNYRHLRQSYLNNIFGTDHPAYPVVELASRTRTLNIGDNPATAPLATDNPDWMRWNNLGIGYLDQLQYDDAMQRLRAGRRACARITRTAISTSASPTSSGKNTLRRARRSRKRSTLHPDDARALYYMALVERRRRHSEAEIADLQKVVAQYPQSRDARRELGISYYQQHRSDEAMEQFKALQAIDPDDLAAHYNLAILYRRDGHEEAGCGGSRAVHDKENRSRCANLFAGLSAQASGNLDRERAVARAHRHRRTQPTAAGGQP